MERDMRSPTKERLRPLPKKSNPLDQGSGGADPKEAPGKGTEDGVCVDGRANGRI